MDRDALVLRNQTMAAAFHATPLRHYLRRELLFALAELLIPPSRQATITDRILVIRPDHLGDVLLSVPAIRAVRAYYPRTAIHALVGPWSAAVLAPYDEIDAVLTVDFPGFARGEAKDDWRTPYTYALRMARHLRRIGYAKAFVLRPDHWWGAMLAKFAGIPERYGYRTHDTAPFLTHALEPAPGHVAEIGLRLAEFATGAPTPSEAAYSFPVQDDDRAFVQGYLDAWGLPQGARPVCIHPGAGSAFKLWTPERWAAVADVLAEQLDAPLVFTGSDAELPLVQQSVALMRQPAVIMAGDTRVGQLAALFARAHVVLGPDSGPMHLAVAVGAPTVTLFGPADPAEFGPWGPTERHAVLASPIGCRPCRVLDWGDDELALHPCVRDITVAQVLDAARRVAATRRALQD